MTSAKKIISLFMIITMLFSIFGCFTITASAATSSSKQVVSYNAYAGGKISSQTNTFTIKANFFTKRKITIYGSNNFPNKTTLNSFSSLAKFDITVKDKNGSTISSYKNVSFGYKFYLPKWSKNNYTITVTSKFIGYKSGNAYHSMAALTGKYYLKY